MHLQVTTMETLRRVSASTRQVSTGATASGRVDVHGLQARDGFVWIADNRSGRLYRVPILTNRPRLSESHFRHTPATRT